MIFYFASKVKHAPRWRELRERGININSSWIDMPSVQDGEAKMELAKRCIAEVTAADFVVLYAERNDELKGALLECGASLAANRHVICVGQSYSLSRVFTQHPLWHSVNSVTEAIELADTLAEKRTTRTGYKLQSVLP